MKELSIEQKAKAYDKALERAENEYQTHESFNGFREMLTNIFPELKESEDEKIRKEIINVFKSLGELKIPADINFADIFTWLEKQGEQKSTEQVESKFKVGDWVVTSYGKVNQIIAVDEDGDGFTLDDDTYFSGSWKDGYHLWNISDAKDGDVLIVPQIEGSEHSEQIFIFKEINDRDYVKNAVEYYCRVVDNDFYVNERGFMGQSDDYFVPATKSQRDTLFAKIKEAGYNWNPEKKELKKISQEYPLTPDECINPWSEEDEKMFGSVVWHLRNSVNNGEKRHSAGQLEDWLKSLKGRVGCEANCTTTKEWKPSDEQMKALEWALSLAKNCGEESAFDLRTLQEDLKKLIK